MKDLFRRELSGFRAYVQGKPAEAVRREYGLERIEKLASNENQLGPSPLALDAIRDELDELNFYPEARPLELIEQFAAHVGVKPENIVLGNGGEGLLWLISMCFLNEGDEIIVPAPSFDIYGISATFMGGKTIRVPLKDKAFDIPAMLAAVNERTKIFYICTPNNPTGHILPEADLELLLSKLPEDVVLVLDEAYYEFASVFPDYPKNNIALIDRRPNTIVLRTLSKAYGIAGIRMGYLITSPLFAEKLQMIRQTFGVNRLANAAAYGALQDKAYCDMAVKKNKEALDFLVAWFKKQSWDYFPSYANFIWVDSKLNSKIVFEELQKKGVIIRPGFLWGWDSWMRLSTGTPEQMRFFAEKMEEVIEEGKAQTR